MTKVTERWFNANGEDGWGTNQGGANRYVPDATAPIDTPTVLEMPFGPCTNCGSNSMGNQIVKNWAKEGLPTGRELWIEGWHKWSSNWAQNPSQVSKLMYIFDAGQINSPAIISAASSQPGTSQPMRISVWLQGQDNRPCGHNFSHVIRSGAPGTLPRGQWNSVKVYLRHNSPGECDAVVRVWVNDKLAIDRTGFRFRDPGYGGSFEWAGINFNPVWGGGRGSLPAEQTLRTAYLLAMAK